MESSTAVYEHVEGWWIGYVEELPGANAQERTLDAVRESLTEAVQLIHETYRGISRRSAEGRDVIREALVASAARSATSFSST